MTLREITVSCLPLWVNGYLETERVFTSGSENHSRVEEKLTVCHIRSLINIMLGNVLIFSVAAGTTYIGEIENN
jgi:hypothetical protein